MFALCSCEEIKDQITVDIPFDSFTIELDDIVVGDNEVGAKSAIVRLNDALNQFYAERILNVNQPNIGIPADVLERLSNIVSVEVGKESSITVTATDDNGTVVENFLMVGTDMSNNLDVGLYELGTTYSDKVEAFATELLMKLVVNREEVLLTISGMTDVVDGEKLKVIITLRDGLFKAKAFE